MPALGWQGTMLPATQIFTALGTYVNPAFAAYVPLLADKYVDVKQTGSGITPILSFMATPIEGLVLTVRYEFNTSLELTNKTTEDDTGLFPDGEKNRADIPATLAFGAQYAVMPQLRVHFSLNTDFDKNADWGGREDLVTKNTLEIAVGAEYDILENVTVSAGYLNSSYGLADDYQSDMDFCLSANTFGAGVKWQINDKLSLEGGVLSVNYKDFSKLINYSIGSFQETYKQTTFCFGFGINYSFQ